MQPASAVTLAAGSGIALAVLAAAPAGLTRPARWFAVTIAGWSASLVLINAPPGVAYQHYAPFQPAPLRPLALALVLGHLLCLLVAGRPHVAAAFRWARTHRHPVALALVAAVAIATSAVPSAEPLAWAVEVTVGASLQLLSLLTLVAAVRSVDPAEQPRIERFVDRVLGSDTAPGPQRIDRWVLVLAAGVTGFTALLAWVVWDVHPHVPDEMAYLIHARYLAEGMLAMPLPPVPAGFNIDLMMYEPTRWYSPVPPGWPFVLAIGAWLGVPWLVNPVLGGVSIVLCFLLAGQLYGRRTARLGTALLACSPWFLFLSMSFMTHALTLVAALAAGVGVARARSTGGWLPALMGGAMTGVLSLVRPLEGLVVAVLCGLWSLGARGRVVRLLPAAAYALGTVVVGALTRPYNAALTGSPDVFPIMAYIDKYYEPGSNAMGFGANRGLGWPGLDPFPGHGPVDVVVNAALNTAQTGIELLGWPFGAIGLIALILLPPWRRLSRADWWMIMAVASVIGVHSFYWFSGGPDFGARYWYLIIFPCCALVARVISRLETESGMAARGRIEATALMLCVATILVFIPWRATGKYKDYRGMRADVRRLAAGHDFGRSLVLVRGGRHPDYHSAAIYNPIDLHADAPVYAWDASAEIRAALLDAYPDRRVWVLDGPTLTGDGFRVVAGPLSPAQARTLDIPPNAAGSGLVYDPVTPPRRTPP